MRLPVAFMILAGACGTALAEPAYPDLRGTWTGDFRAVVFGSNSHHPGDEDVADPPRVRELAFTIAVEGQDGALFWGREWSDPADKDPFAASITPDGKTIIAADEDGSMIMTVTGPDTMDRCYSHTGLSLSGSIVVSCGTLRRGD